MRHPYNFKQDGLWYELAIPRLPTRPTYLRPKFKPPPTQRGDFTCILDSIHCVRQLERETECCFAGP